MTMTENPGPDGKPISGLSLQKWLDVGRQVARQISATLDLRELLLHVVCLLQESFGYYHVHVYMLDAERGYLNMVEGSGEAGRLMKKQGHRLELGIGLVGHVAATGQSVLVSDVNQDNRWLPNRWLPETTAELTVPLKLRGPGKEEIVGVLDVQSDKTGELTDKDLVMLEYLSDHIAVAARNARLFEQLEQRNQQLAALNAVSSTLNQSLSLDEVLASTLAQVLETLAYDVGLVCLVDLQTGKLNLTAHQGLTSTLYEQFEKVGSGGTLSALVFEKGDALSIGDLTVDVPVDVSELLMAGLCAYLGTPLAAKGKVLGTLCLFARQTHYATEADLDLMRAIGAKIAVAVENTRLFESARRAHEEERQRAEELGALHEISLELAQEQGDLDAVLGIVARRAMELLDADGGGIWLWREGDQELELVIAFRVDNAEVAGRRLKPGAGLSGRAFVERKIQVVNDYLGSTSSLPTSDRASFFAAMSVPMFWQTHAVGVLTVTRSQEGHPFSVNEQYLAELLAGQAAATIENARLLEETQRSLEKLQAAYQVQDRLSQTVQELSSPVIQIWEDILVLPLVGDIDSARAMRIMEDLLEGIVRHQAEIIILDVTGVPVVDTSVANYLLKTVKAAGMLGAKSILVGISGHIAQTMINIGIDLSEVETRGNLRAGIEYALSLVGQAIGPREEED
jgi:rsbT co-antagonist protein RsbR